MLGKISERTCRLNFYVHKPSGAVRTYTAEAWGYGQYGKHKCLVIRDTAMQGLRVLGAIISRASVPREDRDLMMRCRVVEEGLGASERHEWKFIIDEVDEATKAKVLGGPLIEPARLVGESLHL